MHIVKVSGVDGTRSPGHDEIHVDGQFTYIGRAADGAFFEITYREQHLIARAAFEYKSTWRALLGNDRVLIRDADGVMIATIVNAIPYSQLLGRGRTLTIAEHTYSLPRQSAFELLQHYEFPNATIAIDRRRQTTTAEIADSHLLLPYTSVAFYLWFCLDVDDR